MSSITLFSAPKPFSDPRIASIQNNALASWSQLGDVEILLMGEGEGISEASERVGARHLGGVLRNASGTPLISSMIYLAREYSRSDLLCIINADMIVMHDLLEAALNVKGRLRRFVGLSRRWDLAMDAVMDYSAGWEERLRETVRRKGQLHGPAGSDFFLFPRDCYTQVPDFAVGRAGWDNWMIYNARRQGWPVIDCTPSVVAVHQIHDYSHLPGGVPHYGMPESAENIRLAGGEAPIRYTLLDATHCLRAGRLVRSPMSYARLMRGIELLLRRVFFFLPAPLIEEVARPKRWKRRLMRIFGVRNGNSGGLDG